MSRLANEALNFQYDDDMEDAARELAEMQREHEERDGGRPSENLVGLRSSHLNPLGLVAGDLTAVGWDSDNTGTSWMHADHGAHSFLGACRIEANKVSPEDDGGDF